MLREEENKKQIERVREGKAGQGEKLKEESRDKEAERNKRLQSSGKWGNMAASVSIPILPTLHTYRACDAKSAGVPAARPFSDGNARASLIRSKKCELNNTF